MNINEIKADLTSEAKPGAHLQNSKGGTNDLISSTPSQLLPGHLNSPSWPLSLWFKPALGGSRPTVPPSVLLSEVSPGLLHTWLLPKHSLLEASVFFLAE